MFSLDYLRVWATSGRGLVFSGCCRLSGLSMVVYFNFEITTRDRSCKISALSYAAADTQLRKFYSHGLRQGAWLTSRGKGVVRQDYII